MKKILVCYASAGEGHKKAAFAVYEALRRLVAPDVQVTMVDSLDYTNNFFKLAYEKIYIFLVKYTPTIWGFFYYMLDTKFFFTLNQPFRVMVNALNTRRLVDFLNNEKFDICVSTHFMATEVISRLKREGRLDIKLITVITDFQSHLFWLSKGGDAFVVAADSTKQELISRAIAEDKITVCGIPIEDKFSVEKSKDEIIQKLKVTRPKFTILVMGGGYGVGPIKEIVMQLQGLKQDCQILVVCGRNKNLFKELSALKEKFKRPTFIFGFCNNMDEIMYLSDVMISKVGGLSSSESLASELPIVAISPIPGQEMRNAKFLLKHNIGFLIKRPNEVDGVVEGLISDESKFDEIKQKIAQIAKPKSAQAIANLTLKWIKN
ncbi:MAG: glycosyltransferase [Candidatus Omnitrophota bacterium]